MKSVVPHALSVACGVVPWRRGSSLAGNPGGSVCVCVCVTDDNDVYTLVDAAV